MFSSLQAGLQWRALKRDRIALLLLCLSPGFVPVYSAGMYVYVCVCVVCARQGEGADLSQSDRCNDPTSGDLIWRGIADPVMLPSATCAPFKFPAAVSPDRRREISGEWGEDGVLGDPGLCFTITPCCFLVKTK